MNAAPRALGIDPGTVSFDVCGREGERLFLDRTLSTAEVGRHPDVLIDVLRAAGPVDLIVGPSGYGLPWVGVADLGPRETDLMLLGDAGERPPGATIVGGMGRIMRALRESGLPVCFAPGVIHLASVPEPRKVNRIDMGTADKLCAVALGIWDQARRFTVPYAETSFIYVELGGAFTAVIAVEDGAVVDGAGGTSGAMGYSAAGALDGEVAYLMRGFAKCSLASGGVAWVAGAPDAAPDALAAASGDRLVSLAWEAFLEDVVKRVAAEMTVLDAPREVLLSGRLSRVPWVEEQVSGRLARFAAVRRVEGYAEVAKEAAQGAALIGQGLVGGPLEELVEAMRLRDARGTVLDHLYVDEMDDLRGRYRQSEPGPAPFWERR